MLHAFAADSVFNGETWLDNHVVIVKERIVEDVVPRDGYKGAIKTFDNFFIAPAFIDLQVYGSGGKLFSVYPEAKTLELMRSDFEKTGTVLFLPTVATNTIEVFKKSIDAVRDYWKNGGAGVPGIHLEGPWLNADKRGAHSEENIRIPSEAEVRELLQYGRGVIKMITIAPEVFSSEQIREISEQGIILSAGHSNATYEQAMTAFDGGVKSVTHLYNAMSSLQHRAPGLVGASFMHPKVMASIIPDRYHVDYAAIKIARKMMGERLFAITDAVTETSTGPYQHHLVGDKYECNGVLSGSALSMHKAFRNLVHHCGIEVEEALRMCSFYPSRLLGLEKQYGVIHRGANAKLLVLSKNLDFVELITG